MEIQGQFSYLATWKVGKICNHFEGKTYLFADSAIEFNDVKAWKMTEVGNKAKFEAGKL